VDAASRWDTIQFSQQPAKTHSLTGTTRNAWKPRCSWAGTETDPGGIAPACWLGGNFGSPQRIETGSAGVSGTALISGLGRTSYENIIEPCRALNSRSPVDRVAERHGSLANRNHQPASQHHGRGAKAGGEAGGETTAAGATGKHGCSSPDIASLSSATDISTKAGARFSDGGDCRA
jgi:hypothetical protein